MLIMIDKISIAVNFHDSNHPCNTSKQNVTVLSIKRQHCEKKSAIKFLILMFLKTYLLAKEVIKFYFSTLMWLQLFAVINTLLTFRDDI